MDKLKPLSKFALDKTLVTRDQINQISNIKYLFHSCLCYFQSFSSFFCSPLFRIEMIFKLQTDSIEKSIAKDLLISQDLLISLMVES